MAASAHAELEAAKLPEDRPVGIRARKSPEAIALVLACLQARRPFLLPSVELAPETLAQLFAQAGASRVLEPHGPRSESASLRAIEEPRPVAEEVGPSGRPPPAATTSRSCSRRRARPGCPRSCRSRRARSTASPTGRPRSSTSAPGTVVANYAPLNFDLCLLDIWTTLKRRRLRRARRPGPRDATARYLADLLADNEVNVLQAVPMLYRLLIDVTQEDGRRFPSVQHAITTGDKIPASSLEALPGLFPNARFFNIYGCTETNDSLIHEFEGLDDGEVPTNVPVGQPHPRRAHGDQDRRRCASSTGPGPASSSCGLRSRRAAI